MKCRGHYWAIGLNGWGFLRGLGKELRAVCGKEFGTKLGRELKEGLSRYWVKCFGVEFRAVMGEMLGPLLGKGLG